MSSSRVSNASQTTSALIHDATKSFDHAFIVACTVTGVLFVMLILSTAGWVASAHKFNDRTEKFGCVRQKSWLEARVFKNKSKKNTGKEFADIDVKTVLTHQTWDEAQQIKDGVVIVKSNHCMACLLSLYSTAVALGNAPATIRERIVVVDKETIPKEKRMANGIVAYPSLLRVTDGHFKLKHFGIFNHRILTKILDDESK